MDTETNKHDPRTCRCPRCLLERASAVRCGFCPDCGGTGWTPTWKACDACDGTGDGR